jgi:hypothetical protein
MRKVRNATKIWLEILKGRRPLGRPRRRSEDNVKMDLGKIILEGAGWIHLAEDRDG